MRLVLIRPLDILHLRGNRLFADAGNGEAVMPPWPSVFAGALRTRILVDRGISFADFAAGVVTDNAVIASIGRNPKTPGTFRLTSVALVAPQPNGLKSPSAGYDTARLGVPYFPLPADLIAVEDTNGGLCLHRLDVQPLDALGVRGSFALPRAPVLRMATPAKPVSNIWLTAAGYTAHLRGEAVLADAAVRSSLLWSTDPRLGIALGGSTRTARTGLLYTSDTVSLAPGAGFLVGVTGADGLLPSTGLLRLGGDGGGAAVDPWTPPNTGLALPWLHRPRSLGFRMILATPGYFPGGWLPPGVERDGGEYFLAFRGMRAKLVAAAVPRAETVSGWDLAARRPKPAVRTVPAGAVYWFQSTSGDSAALSELSAEGLWPLWPEDAAAEARRAEGFNNVWFGDWDSPTEEG